MSPLLRTLALAAVGVAAAAGLMWLGLAWNDSRLPDSYNVMDLGYLDYGGGAVSTAEIAHGPAHHDPEATSVASLTGPAAGRADARFTLTAQHRDIHLPSGREVDALTFGGRVPGPELRVHQRDLVEVTLLNRDVHEGVSIHWHGVDVPNAEDGVSGVTQNAVPPGGRHVYRFRVDQAGTFWYHTHQSSAREVKRGLFGAFVVEPRRPSPARTLDETVLVHRFGAITTLNGRDGVSQRAVPTGSQVRLRLVNTDSGPQRILVGPVPFRVLAIDGTDLHGPTPILGQALELAAGGRYDIGFRMPPGAMSIAVARTNTRLVLSRLGDAAGSEPRDGPSFDPARYGTPAATPFDATSHFDRSFRLEIGQKLGFFDGHPGRHWAIDGGIYPDVPTFVVQRGELAKVTIVNDTGGVHPMHLHGHHMLVLSRNGHPVSGSPWWSDTLNVAGHERYEVAFRADNPGLWMDHCHNLTHAAAGLTMHVAYAGVTTPFVTGGEAHNHPE